MNVIACRLTKLPSRARGGVACLAAGLFASSTLANAQALEGTLLVTNREEFAGSVSMFDLPTGKEIARVPIGLGWPHEIAVSPDGRLALTAEYGLETPGEQVVVIDIRRAQIVGIIRMGAGSKPHDSVFLPDNRHAIVTLETIDRLALVDVQTLSVVRTYPIGAGAREGHMITLSPDASRVYVGGRLGQGTVSVVYLDGDRPPVVIPTGLGAEAIAVTPDDEVWVLNQDANTISVIDPDTLVIKETFAAATQPRRLANLPGGRMAIINGNSEVAGIRIYASATRTVIGNIAVPGQGAGAEGFGFLALGSRAFVSTRADERILLYDLDAPDTAPIEFATRHDTPDGMAWSPLRINVLENR